LVTKHKKDFSKHFENKKPATISVAGFFRSLLNRLTSAWDLLKFGKKPISRKGSFWGMV